MPVRAAADDGRELQRDPAQSPRRAAEIVCDARQVFQPHRRNARSGQSALDQFGTRTYATFTTVNAQFGFCETAGAISAEAAYAPRGEFYKVAVARLNTLRNALVPWGEEQFQGAVKIDTRTTMPRLDAACWSKKGEWVAKKCGTLTLARR